ncbi:MAG: hypothetical protein ABI665_02540 [Vicinamibacterales bacterium]
MARSVFIKLCAVAIVAGSVMVSAQAPIQLPMEPPREFGTSITGSMEGWFENPDGSKTFIVGYLNRNAKQEIDIPIGPNNNIEPGGPDFGQPTHFMPHRQLGMFTVTVPKEFTAQQRLTWSITVNGKTNTIPLKLTPDYILQPFKDVAVGNTPPIIKFSPDGPTIQGPIAAMSRAVAMTVKVGQPLSLPMWATDDGKYTSGSNAQPRNLPPPIELDWSKYRGPGTVTFAKAKPEVKVLAGGPVGVEFRGEATTTVTFGAPGDYVLHLNVDDFSGRGSGETGCCWTTAMVKVTVAP